MASGAGAIAPVSAAANGRAAIGGGAETAVAGAAFGLHPDRTRAADAAISTRCEPLVFSLRRSRIDRSSCWYDVNAVVNRTDHPCGWLNRSQTN